MTSDLSPSGNDFIAASKKDDASALRSIWEHRCSLPLPTFDVNSRDSDHRCALHYASYLGYLQNVKFLIEIGADVNAADKKGSTPLYFAVMRQNLDVVDFLLKSSPSLDPNIRSDMDETRMNALYLAGAVDSLLLVERLMKDERVNVRFTDAHGWTMLHLVSQNGNAQILKYLLESGRFDIDCRDESGWTPLHRASNEGHAACMELLVTHGADVNLQDSQEFTPLHKCASHGHTEGVKLLLRSDGIELELQEMTGNTPTKIAIITGHYDIVGHLLSAGAEVPGIALHIASSKGDLKMLDLLLQHNASLSERAPAGFTALHYAAQGGSLPVVDRLLKAGCDPHARNESGSRPYHIAAIKGHIDVLNRFLSINAVDVNALGASNQSMLHFASTYGHLSVVERLLLEPSLDMHALGDRGNNALHFAAQSGSVPVVKTLLAAGVDVNCKNEDGTTPLHYACHCGHAPIVDYLASSKVVDKLALDNKGESCLFHALRSKNVDVLNRVLRIEGISVNDANKIGSTVLHESTSQNLSDMVEHLLACAAINVKTKDMYGMNAMHRASLNGVVDALRRLAEDGRIDINEGDMNGYTAFHYAVDDKRLDVLEFLLTLEGLDLNVISKAGHAPIHMAASNGHIEAMKILIHSGKFDPNSRSKNGTTPLAMAARSGHFGVVDFLLRQETIDVNLRETEHYYSPLHHAVAHDRVRIVERLLAHKSIHVNSSDQDLNTPLIVSARRGCTATARVLVTAGKAEVNATSMTGLTALHAAVSGGHLEMVNLLLENGADHRMVEKGNATPLVYAVSLNKQRVAMRLLDLTYADIDARDDIGERCTLLELTTVEDCLPLFQRVLLAGADIHRATVFGGTILHFAAMKNAAKIVSYLLKVNVLDANAFDKNGQTAFHCAAISGGAPLVKLMMDSGRIDVGARTKVDTCEDLPGATALHYASFIGRGELISMLAEKIDPNLRSKDGYTALHIAAQLGWPDIVADLCRLENIDVNAKHAKTDGTALYTAVKQQQVLCVEALAKTPGVDVNAKAKFQRTALHEAAMRNSTSIIDILLAVDGIDLNARDEDGSTAFHLAASFGANGAVVRLLSKPGVDVLILDEQGETALDNARKLCTTYSTPETIAILVASHRFHLPITSCPRGHTMSMPSVAVTCNQCNDDFDVNSEDIRGCERCNFDICNACVAAEADRQTPAPLEVVSTTQPDEGAESKDAAENSRSESSSSYVGLDDTVDVDDTYCDVDPSTTQGDYDIEDAVATNDSVYADTLSELTSQLEQESEEKQAPPEPSEILGDVTAHEEKHDEDPNEAPRYVTFDEFSVTAKHALQFAAKGTSHKKYIRLYDLNSTPIHQISQGNFGYVFRGRYRTGDVIIKVDKVESGGETTTEYTISATLRDHVNLCLPIGLCTDFRTRALRFVNPGIVFPMMHNGSVLDYLEEHPRIRFDEDALLKISLGMIRGIQALHTQRVIHRDIALRNFFMSKDGRIALGDFGMSRRLPTSGYFDGLKGKSDEEQYYTANTGACPWRHSPPESLSRREHYFGSDMWMFGASLLELMTGKPPFSVAHTYYEFVQVLKPETFPRLVKAIVGALPPVCPPVLKELVVKCCAFEKTKRPTAGEAEQMIYGQRGEKSWEMLAQRL